MTQGSSVLNRNIACASAGLLLLLSFRLWTRTKNSTFPTWNPSTLHDFLAVRSFHDVKNLHVDHVLHLELFSVADQCIWRQLINLFLNFLIVRADTCLLSWPRFFVGCLLIQELLLCFPSQFSSRDHQLRSKLIVVEHGTVS